MRAGLSVLRKRRGRRRLGVIVAVAGTVLVAATAAATAPPPPKPIPPGERLTPAATRVVRTFLDLQNPPIPSLSPMAARNTASIQSAATAVASAQGKPTVQPVGDVSHITIPTPAGKLLARVYSPSGGGPFPVLVYFHGGGWVIANLDTYDASARALSVAAGAVVVSVAYRQAPEHRFPAAANDAYWSLQWVMQNAAGLHGDPHRVSVGGESAGGNLATVATLMTRDRGGRMPVAQVLVYPITNYDFSTPSYLEEAKSVPLDRASMRWFWAQYLPSPAAGRNRYASPLRARSLRDLPPAVVITDENDPLRSEGEAYAAKLRRDGVRVIARRFDRVMHEFFGMPSVLPQARQAIALAAQAIRAARP